MQRPVAANRLQREFQATERHAMGPGQWSKQTTTGLIVEVYDGYTKKLKKQIQDGRIYAAVALLSGMVYTLPFGDPIETVLGQFGNRENLLEKKCVVEFSNNNVLNGVIYMKSEGAVRAADIKTSTTVWSIGGIV